MDKLYPYRYSLNSVMKSKARKIVEKTSQFHVDLFEQPEDQRNAETAAKMIRADRRQKANFIQEFSASISA